MNEVNRTIGEKPELRWVAIDDIYVDHNYQRDLKEHRVRAILREFNWRDFQPVSLTSKPDGRFAVQDGQHRVEAARRHPMITEVPACIVALSSVEEEAESFIAINSGRVAVTPVEKYWAGLTAGDQTAVRIKNVLDEAGCEITPAPGVTGPNKTNAVSAIERALGLSGDAAVRDALTTIRGAWPNEAKALKGTVITALSRLIRSNPEIDRPRLVRILAGQTPGELSGNAEAMRKIAGGSAETAIRLTLTEQYNRGLSKNRIYFGEKA
ncbi:MAG: hypothetical protein K8H74_18050 [Notoacmeibacter sp.]|nr:hypothetical protein [Notoacmeibacter sp.]